MKYSCSLICGVILGLLALGPSAQADGEPLFACIASWSEAFDRVDEFVLREVDGSSAEILSDNFLSGEELTETLRIQKERYACLLDTVCEGYTKLIGRDDLPLSTLISPVSQSGGPIPNNRSTCPPNVTYEDIYTILEIDVEEVFTSCAVNSDQTEAALLESFCFEHAQQKKSVYEEALTRVYREDIQRRAIGLLTGEMEAMRERVQWLTQSAAQSASVYNGIFSRACTVPSLD